jgi:alpha-amylase
MTLLHGDMSRAKMAGTLLLTLPGLPFVYYGEELGMSGDKPDPRLRTPMQWTTGHADGFTSGKPWEALQSDSASITIATEDADASSLLNLYRRLIHLRSANEALAAGRLVALSPNAPSVVAYLRRSGSKAVLVVANLGDAAMTDVAIGSASGALPAGTYEARSLLGGRDGAALTVTQDGRMQSYVPSRGRLGSREAVVFDLVRR